MIVINLKKKLGPVLLWKCAGNGLLSVWIKLWESFFFIHFTSKQRYLIWNTGSLSRTAGEDTPLFINTACLTEMCCWKGEAEWKSVGGLVEGKQVYRQLVKQTLLARVTFRWLLLCSEIGQFIYVVLWGWWWGGGGVTLWLEFFECLAFMNRYRAPFKNNARLWREWRCDAGTVPLLYQRS